MANYPFRLGARLYYPEIGFDYKEDSSLAPLHFSPTRRKKDRIGGGVQPGSKAIARKKHKARFISWPGRASRFFLQREVVAL